MHWGGCRRMAVLGKNHKSRTPQKMAARNHRTANAVVPKGFEPSSQEPESCILSIELRNRRANMQLFFGNDKYERKLGKN